MPSKQEENGLKNSNSKPSFNVKRRNQGGQENYLSGQVSLRLIDGRDNSRGGNRLRSFFRECDVNHNGTYKRWFGVLAVPDLSITTSVCANN